MICSCLQVKQVTQAMPSNNEVLSNLSLIIVKNILSKLSLYMFTIKLLDLKYTNTNTNHMK